MTGASQPKSVGNSSILFCDILSLYALAMILFMRVVFGNRCHVVSQTRDYMTHINSGGGIVLLKMFLNDLGFSSQNCRNFDFSSSF